MTQIILFRISKIDHWDYLENNLPNPTNPPLLKGGEGGFSWFAGDEPVMENLFEIGRL